MAQTVFGVTTERIFDMEGKSLCAGRVWMTVPARQLRLRDRIHSYPIRSVTWLHDERKVLVEFPNSDVVTFDFDAPVTVQREETE